MTEKVWLSEMSIPQFHTDPLRSTHQFNIWTTPFQHPKSLISKPKNPSVQHTPQFNRPLSSTRKPLSSTPKLPLLNIKNPSVQHIPQFNTVFFEVELWGVLNWWVSWTEGDPSKLKKNPFFWYFPYNPYFISSFFLETSEKYVFITFVQK